jgi:hypothetical protein
VFCLATLVDILMASGLDNITHDDYCQILDSMSSTLPDSTLPPSSSDDGDIAFIVNHRDGSLPSAVEFYNTNDESGCRCSKE